MINMQTKSIYKKLLNIQTELKAPKNQYNSFGNYKYRNCEDILEALKPILKENNAVVLISDKPIAVGNRIYIESTVKFIDVVSGEETITTAMAREEENKKGMDSSQITGSASSYARKYALNGMFCIDDTKDSDNLNKGKDDTRKNINKNNVTTIDEEVLEKVKRILFLAANKNTDKSIDLLEKYTEFTGKDGKKVKGLREFERLTNGRLKATYGKLQKDFPKLHNQVKAYMSNKNKKESEINLKLIDK